MYISELSKDEREIAFRAGGYTHTHTHRNRHRHRHRHRQRDTHTHTRITEGPEVRSWSHDLGFWVLSLESRGGV
jgi:hypothetical protein